MRHLLANRVQCPDGTILQSFNRHDCKIHKDAVTDSNRVIEVVQTKYRE